MTDGMGEPRRSEAAKREKDSTSPPMHSLFPSLLRSFAVNYPDAPAQHYPNAIAAPDTEYVNWTVVQATTVPLRGRNFVFTASLGALVV